MAFYKRSIAITTTLLSESEVVSVLETTDPQEEDLLEEETPTEELPDEKA